MDKILQQVLDYAKDNENIEAIILTGSRAKKKEVSNLSDYDLCLVCKEAKPLIEDSAWLEEFGKLWLHIDEKVELSNAKIATKLAIYEGGVNIDFMLFPLEAFIQSIADPNLPPFFKGFCEILLDKNEIAFSLNASHSATFKIKKPSSIDFYKWAEEFFFEVFQIAKHLVQNDLWAAKFRDSDVKQRLLFTLIKWHEAARKGGVITFHPIGKKMEKEVDASIWEACFEIYAHFDAKDSFEKLFATITLFRSLAKDCARMWDYSYPEEGDKNVCAYIKKLYDERKL